MDWCWSWNSNTLATWCKEPAHWKRPWCWERLKAEGKGDDRGWDSWMASPTRWTWVWVDSRSWWWTRKPDVLQSMGSQRVGRDWMTELNWELIHVVAQQKLIQHYKAINSNLKKNRSAFCVQLFYFLTIPEKPLNPPVLKISQRATAYVKETHILSYRQSPDCFSGNDQNASYNLDSLYKNVN